MPFGVIAAIGEISIADVAIGVGVGAVAGGGLAAIEGKPILQGAIAGGITGGVTGGLAGPIGGALGSATAGGAIAGTAGGALGAAVTGGNPLVGALEGGVAGGVSGAVGGTGSSDTPPPSTAPAGIAPGAGVAGGSVGAPGVGAAGSAAPATVSLDGGADAALGSSGGSVTSALGGTAPTDAGSVGTALANNPTPAQADPGGGLVPNGTELPAQDATAVQNQVALSQTGGTTQQGLAADAGGNATPPDSGPPDVSFLGSMGLSPTNAQNAWLNPDNSYVLPPTPPTTPIISPTTGQMLSPGDTGYQQGLDAIDAPQYAPAQAAAKTTDWGNFSSNPLGTVGSALSNNSNWLASGAGLGLSAIKSLTSTAPSTTATENTLEGQANTLASNGQQLESYLQTGTLPPGVQNSINSAAQSAKASIRSQYASRGMSGSSAEAADLANVDTMATSQGAKIATQLLNTGVSETGLADQIYGELLKTSISQDNALSSAIGSFASSLVPKTTTTTTTSAAA